MSIENKKETVQSIDRAFLVLETVAKSKALSVNDLHNKLGLNKASLSRIASTLCNNGYLNRDMKTGDYSLSLRAFEVGVQAVRNLDYINLVRSILAELSNNLNAIAQFSIEDKNELLCLESFEQNSNIFSIYARMGQRTPLYSTSAGKAILSTYSNEEIIEKMQKVTLHSLTATTITDIKLLLQEIVQTRQRGYGLDMEETEPGVFCVGTVLMNYNRKPIGAISLSTSTLPKNKEKQFSEALLEYTQRISSLLGVA